MTENEIISLILDNLEMKGTGTLEKAQSYFNAAVSQLGKMDEAYWNKEVKTISTVNGQSSYVIGTDILTDKGPVTGISQIWRTDIQGAQVPIWRVDKFNSYARGSTSTGAPRIACLHSKTQTLEFYYIPDGVYSLWSYVRYPLYFTDIPDHHNIILAWMGIMIGSKPAYQAYSKAKDLYVNCLKDISSESLDKWDGSRIVPEFLIGQETETSGNPNTDNFYGL